MIEFSTGSRPRDCHDRSSCAGTLPLAAFVFLVAPLLAGADDIPAPTQKIGSHSTIATEDGAIRDDYLVNYICQAIIETGGQVKDVKVFVNACYGGGILDDMQRAFGPGGLCEGIPWVGGSASAPDKPAYGWSDSVVDMFPAENLGSTWTDALAGNSHFNKGGQAGVISNGSASNNVLQDLQATRNKDDSGPNGDNSEAPQIASGNGGDQIMWNMEGASHEAIVFGGDQSDKRHSNNVENVTSALGETWEGSPHNIQSIDGGTTDELLNAIITAALNLDQNTQLVLYLDDHGGSSFDFEEAIGGIANILFEDEETIEFDLPPGWFEGFMGNYFGSKFEMAAPTLDLNITDCMYCASWGYNINGMPLFFPGGDTTGMVNIPVPFWYLQPGANELDLVPMQPSTTQRAGTRPQTHNGFLTVSSMELSTNGINDLEADPVLVPGQSAAFYDPNRSGEGIFLELLADGRAVAYMFSYPATGTGQLWTIAVGEQVAHGVIFHEVFRPTGPSFGPGFDPGDVVMNEFGSMFLRLPTCGNAGSPGSLFIYPGADSGHDNLFNFNYTQLSSVVDCAGGSGVANASLSGSWYDQSHSGEGIILQVLTNGDALVQWFTYDANGDQMWLQGIGTFDGDTLTVDELVVTDGTNWGEAFDANDVQRNPWGSVEIVFNGCNTATVNYDSTTGFGSGTLNMTRLSSLMGIECT